MKTTVMSAACLFAMCVTQFASAQTIKGRNVERVDVANASGTPLGNFRQTGPKSWRESPAGFSFKEIGRDEWSVYLYDASRKVSIQLDLYTGYVKYRDAGMTSYRNLYRISKTYGPPPTPPKRQTLSEGARSGDTALILWDGDASATAYELQVYVQGQYRTTLKLAGPRAPIDLRQLKQNEGIPANEVISFGFHVRGVNAAGAGVWSHALHIAG